MIILSGHRPTGKLHLGHYVGSIEQSLKLQHSHTLYLMIADMQALTDNFKNPKLITENINEVVADYVSCGIDINKTIIFLQSSIPELAELTMYFMNIVNMGQIQRNPTIKAEVEQKGYTNNIPVGFLCYPISQISDILAFNTDYVSVGNDQLPMIELTNLIARRFNYLYNSDIKTVTPLLGSAPRLLGTDGHTKMSKSLKNTIELSASKEKVKELVFKMYTDKDHIHISDPGRVEGNTVFTYLSIFHRDQNEVEDLKARYRKGGIADTMLKSLLSDVLNIMLEPIRERRSQITPTKIQEILEQGNQFARKQAIDMLNKVRTSIWRT